MSSIGAETQNNMEDVHLAVDNPSDNHQDNNHPAHKDGPKTDSGLTNFVIRTFERDKLYGVTPSSWAIYGLRNHLGCKLFEELANKVFLTSFRINYSFITEQYFL